MALNLYAKGQEPKQKNKSKSTLPLYMQNPESEFIVGKARPPILPSSKFVGLPNFTSHNPTQEEAMKIAEQNRKLQSSANTFIHPNKMTPAQFNALKNAKKPVESLPDFNTPDSDQSILKRSGFVDTYKLEPGMSQAEAQAVQNEWNKLHAQGINANDLYEQEKFERAKENAPQRKQVLDERMQKVDNFIKAVKNPIESIGKAGDAVLNYADKKVLEDFDNFDKYEKMKEQFKNKEPITMTSGWMKDYVGLQAKFLDYNPYAPGIVDLVKYNKAKDKQALKDKARKQYEKMASDVFGKSEIPSTAKQMELARTESYSNLTKDMSKSEKMATDIGLGTVQLASDIGVSAMTGMPISAYYGVTGGADGLQEALDKGHSADKSMVYGIGSGAITTLIERIGGVGGDAVTKPLSKLIGNKVLGKVALDALSEGSEESLEYVIQTAWKNGILNENEKISLQTAIDSGVIGGAIGGLFGGANVASQNSLKDTTMGKNSQNEQITNANNQSLQQEEKLIANLGLFNENDLSNLNLARKKVVEFARVNFPISVINKETNMSIGISRNGIDKLLSGNISKEKYASAFHVPTLVENAKLVATQPYSKNKTGIGEYSYFDSQISIGNKEYTAHIRVRKTDMGQKYYGHTVSGKIDKIEIEPLARGSVDKSTLHSVNASGSTYNNSIFQNDENINTSSENFTGLPDIQQKAVESLPDFEKPPVELLPKIKLEDGGEYEVENNTSLENVPINKSSDKKNVYRKAFVDSIAETYGIANEADIQNLDEYSNVITKEIEANGSLSDDSVETLLNILYDSEINSKIDISESAEKLNDLVQNYSNYINNGYSQFVATTVDEVKKAHDAVYNLKKYADKVSKTYLLSVKEKKVVDALLKGSYDVEDISSDVNKESVLKVYEAKKAVQDQSNVIAKFNSERKAELRENALSLIENSTKWNDKKTGFQYSRETMERNFRDIIKDKSEAEAIINEYFNPVHINEASAIKMKNNYRDRIRKLDMNKYESVYTQMFGEYQYHASQKLSKKSQKEAELLQKRITDYQSKYGKQIDESKVKKAVPVFQKIYNELFERVNDVLVRNGYKPVDYRKGYFPHFVENKPDTLLEKVGKSLGFDFKQQELPTDIAGLTHTFKPGKKWVGNFLTRKGETTDYDALKGFDRYIEGIADVVHHTEDIQKLRALESAIRYKYSDEGTQQEIDDVNGLDISEDEKQVLLKELYDRDLSHLPHLVQELRTYTDNLAGKKSLNDRMVESDIGRGIYSTIGNIENRLAANMVAINPASWMTNFIPIQQGYSELSTKSMLKGLQETLSNYKSNDGFAEQSSFLTNRRGSDPLSQTSIEKLSSTLSKPMYYVDDFTSNLLTRARTYDNINKRKMGETAAIMEADSWVASVMADRSKGALPTVFNRKNPITKLFTTFQVEVNNQLSYLFKDMPRTQKELGISHLAGALLKYLIGAFLYNEIYEKLVGRKPALDPIGMVKESFQDFANEDISKSEAVSNAGTKLLQQLPFVGGLLGGGRLPISSALPDVKNLVKATDEEMPANKKAQLIGKEIAKPASYLLLPFGGGQVKKIADTAKTVSDGGSYTLNSKGQKQLQFPLLNENKLENATDILTGSIFGKYSLKEAKQYLKGDINTLSVKETTAYDTLTKDGVSRNKAYDIILNVERIGKEQAALPKDKKDPNAKRDYIIGLPDITPKQKNLLDELLVGELKNKRDYTDTENYKKSQLSEIQQKKYDLAKNTLGIDIDTFNNCLGYIKDVKAQKDASGKAVSGSAKKGKIIALRRAGLTYEQAERLYNILY